MIYGVIVKVEQIVTRDIEMAVEARDIEEATKKAIEAAHHHPLGVDQDLGIKRCCTVKSKFWPPREVDVLIQEA